MVSALCRTPIPKTLGEVDGESPAEPLKDTWPRVSYPVCRAAAFIDWLAKRSYQRRRPLVSVDSSIWMAVVGQTTSVGWATARTLYRLRLIHGAGCAAAQKIGADACRDPRRRIVHRVPCQLGVACGHLHPGLAQKAAVDRQALTESKSAGRPTVSGVMKPQFSSPAHVLTRRHCSLRFVIRVPSRGPAITQGLPGTRGRSDNILTGSVDSDTEGELGLERCKEVSAPHAELRTRMRNQWTKLLLPHRVGAGSRQSA